MRWSGVLVSDSFTNVMLLFPSPSEPFIRHSKQNLALGMKTEASSTDNYNGCKNKHCKEISALGQLAVDGSFDSCFLSLTEFKPWLIVHLREYHPIALVQVALRTPESEQIRVYVGNGVHCVKVSRLNSVSALARRCRRNFQLCYFQN